jgi:hypothetical protein
LEYISDKVGSKNLYIISHKTKFDSFGKGFDLRNAANQWLDRHVWTSGIVMKSQVKYCSTKAEKIGYIQQINCHIFFDDLEEIIDELQGKVRFPILFDRRSSASQTDERRLSGSWAYLADFIDQQ